MMTQQDREQRGLQIVNLNGQIKRINAYSYKVKSQSENGDYEILNSEVGWIRSCPDHKFRGLKCKHKTAR